MNFHLIYLLYCLTCFSCGKKHIAFISNNQLNKDTLFVKWNVATSLSLRNSAHSASDSIQKKYYENRTVAFKNFLDIQDERLINTESIRYKFLDELSKNIVNKSRFYVIETKQSGEEVEIRNYLILFNTKGVFDVIVYNFKNRKWVKDDKLHRVSSYFEFNLSKYVSKFGEGFNQDDVVITEFENGAVKDSEYYLYGTLLGLGYMSQILSLK